MIDQKRCMAKRDGEPLGGERCQAAATHETLMGPRCAKHAEEFKQALRDPRTLGNVMAGRARTEDEIALLVRELQ